MLNSGRMATGALEAISGASGQIDLRPYRCYVPVKWGTLVAVAVHAVVLTTFVILGVKEMVYFNVFSVPLYVLSYFLNERGMHSTAMTLGISEVLVHQTLCAYYVGMGAGFQYYILAVACLAFFVPSPRYLVKTLAFIGSGAVFVMLDFPYTDGIPVYQVEPTLLSLLYYANMVSAIGVMGVIVFYYSLAGDVAEEALSVEHQKSEILLNNILPESIAARLKDEGKSLADGFESASILFADIVGFTELSAQRSPQELAELLNDIFSVFDDLVEQLGLEKIKTIGDAYMVASGVPTPRADHAEAIATLALRMQEELSHHQLPDGRAVRMRIGINSGPVVAGVIGKKKFIYDLWGDTVNTASRMESHGLAGRIHVAPEAYVLLKDTFSFTPRGPLEVKGKGPMNTWFLDGRLP